MRQVLPECGVTFPQGPATVTAFAHPCLDCGQAFQDAAALASHRYMKHGARSAHWSYCAGTVCPVCLYERFSTDRLLWHMKQSNPRRPCLQWTQQHLMPEETIDRVPLPERIESDAVGRYSALVPSATEAAEESAIVPSSNPQPPVHQCLSLVDHAALPAWLEQCVEDQEWVDPFVAEDLPEYLTCCFERDFGVILDEVTTTDEVDLIQACEHWGQRVDKQSGLRLTKVEETMMGLQNLLGLQPGLQPGLDPSTPPLPCLMSGKTQSNGFGSCRQRMRNSPFVPRLQDPRCGFPGQKPTFYVLHLFSGHARRGDLAWWVEKVTQHQPATIAFDVVHHAEKGDLTNENTFNFLMALLRSGRVLAVQAGPPCETWSVARHQALEGGGRAPRPLRSRWQLRRWLLHTPEVSRVRVRQWEWGQQAVKPTDFLIAHLPSLRRRLSETRLHRRDRPTLTSGGARGKDEKGAWRTAPLKVYPSALCHGFALAFSDVAARLWQRGVSIVTDEPFADWLSHLEAKGIQMGPDWHAKARL
eukprot:symbB.v1.2.037671.t1/scaffold5629.1/size25172/1